ncbi:hypothetical protein, partial [Pseudomonas amygdali]
AESCSVCTKESGMTIDWSKAPEGATHLTLPNSPNQRPVFWRVADGKALEAWAMEKDFSVARDHFRYGTAGCASFIDWLAIPKPAPWNGEGVPPVGVACEYQVGGGTWFECDIRYVTNPGPLETIEVVMYAPHLKGEQVGEFGSGPGQVNFRPIRTAEQIEAIERRVAIAEMKQCFDSVSDDLMPTSNSYLEVLFGALHEAGYRKQVSP